MWWIDISPGSSTSGTACSSSTSTAISWPRASALSSANVSRCGRSAPRWLPGITFIAPFASFERESAIHAVQTFGGWSAQYVPSWCHVT